ncbi:extensin family protein [Paracoccus sediminis]|uniref:Uncharacterized conserved protein n=1 Tax=Paracoccus sediminis TaxID=1214787 RepID=A0A238W3M2_9RHOB|nr:extensin family protein [Paracoccus sediminis]SNR41152.1 Uncharacterized conserved protein [Paracoccus sediminis]
MNWLGAVLLALGMFATPAAAQDRPPERPDDIRKQPEAILEDTSSPAAAIFGPPAPPAWWALREADADFAACTQALSGLGTVYSLEQPIADDADRDCGIARPIRVTHILPGLTLDGGAVMRCGTARSLGLWARDFLRPAAALLPGAPTVAGLQLGTTYDCRPRVGTGEARPKLSEHALGNAIDIAAITFDGAGPLTIQPRRDTGDLAEAFQRTVRSAGCLFFTTVLGPGSNAAHGGHLHLDVAARRGGWRLCQ